MSKQLFRLNSKKMIIALNVKAFDVHGQVKDSNNRVISSKSTQNFVARNLHKDFNSEEISVSDSDIQDQRMRFSVQPDFQSYSSQYQIENVEDCSEEYNKRIKMFKDRIRREQLLIHQVNEDDGRQIISFALEDEEKLKWLEKRIEKVNLKKLLSEAKMLQRRMTLSKKNLL